MEYVTCISIGVYTFLPSTKEAAVIYLVPKVVNNEKVQNISENGLDILVKLTNQYLKDLGGEVGEELLDEKARIEK